VIDRSAAKIGTLSPDRPSLARLDHEKSAAIRVIPGELWGQV